MTMAIINISRQPYCFHEEIANEVAKKLNYRLIDKSIINEKVKDLYCDFADELNDLADEKNPGFFKNFFKNSQVYNCLLQSLLFEEASADKVVFNGRGGQYVLNQPYVLNVRVVAPFNLRCSFLEKKEGINNRGAKIRLKSKDHESESFIRYLFKKDVSNPDSYDLIFNHGKIIKNTIVSTILDYARELEKTNPLTNDDKLALRCLSLEKRVEATLKKYERKHDQLKIECKNFGAIKLKGFVFNDAQEKKLTELAQLCNGVTSVDNRLVRVHSGV